MYFTISDGFNYILDYIIATMLQQYGEKCIRPCIGVNERKKLQNKLPSTICTEFGLH